MAAFQPYAGVFTRDGRPYRWSCYATAKVFELRTLGDPLPAPPPGRTWVPQPVNPMSAPSFVALVDCTVGDFSQILSQVAGGRESIPAA